MVLSHSARALVRSGTYAVHMCVACIVCTWYCWTMLAIKSVRMDEYLEQRIITTMNRAIVLILTSNPTTRAENIDCMVQSANTGWCKCFARFCLPELHLVFPTLYIHVVHGDSKTQVSSCSCYFWLQKIWGICWRRSMLKKEQLWDILPTLLRKQVKEIWADYL